MLVFHYGCLELQYEVHMHKAAEEIFVQKEDLCELRGLNWAQNRGL